MASESRRLRRPLTTSSRSKCRVPAVRASSTGLMPQMRFIRSVPRGGRSRGRRCPPRARAPRGGRCSWPSPTPRGLDPEHPGDRAAHRLEVGREHRLLGDHRDVDVAERVTRRPSRAARSPRGRPGSRRRASAGPGSGSGGPCRPPPMAPRSASQTAWRTQSPSEWPSSPRRVGHLDPAELERAPGHQAVDVEAVADAEARHARTALPRPAPSAQARSSGVVILRLRGEPGTARTGAPSRSTAIASSVTVTRSRKAAS